VVAGTPATRYRAPPGARGRARYASATWLTPDAPVTPVAAPTASFRVADLLP